MIRYLVSRVGGGLVSVFGVCTFIFFIVHLLPGNPVEVMLGFAVTPDRVAKLEHELGLDLPIATQYWRYLVRVIQGDLGRSISLNQPVAKLIFSQLGSTLQLALAAAVVALALGTVAGVLAATRRGSWFDAGTMAAALSGVSAPNFWIGLMLILLFSVHLKWIPITRQSGLLGLVLPTLTLGMRYGGLVARLCRSSMLEVLGQDFIRTARAKGLHERTVLYRHALRNAVLPVITVVGLQFGSMLSGAVIVEVVFARQGLGRLLVQAIFVHDVPLVQGVVLVAASGYVLINALVDGMYGVLDPRVR